jgi:hypothetical protein
MKNDASLEGEDRRPLLTATTYHLGQYTTTYVLAAGFIGGVPSGGDEDIDRQDLGVDHYTSDDHGDVQALLVTRVKEKMGTR